MARVLVVDDNEDILNLVQTRLRKAGHLTVGAQSGDEALQVVAEKGAPEVVVLDVDMPGMTGLELLEELRKRDGLSALPAVFLSAKVQPEDIRRGQELGAAYLTKPFVAAALIDAIDKAIPEKAGGAW
jgi:CheY-like chemotaxis protein